LGANKTYQIHLGVNLDNPKLNVRRRAEMFFMPIEKILDKLIPAPLVHRSYCSSLGKSAGICTLFTKSLVKLTLQALSITSKK
jgi:hypothetical protein